VWQLRDELPVRRDANEEGRGGDSPAGRKDRFVPDTGGEGKIIWDIVKVNGIAFGFPFNRFITIN
jgi:hypothetical protein